MKNQFIFPIEKMSTSGIMYNGTIYEQLIPPTIARKNDFDEYKVSIESRIQEMEKKNQIQQSKISEMEKMIQLHSAMFELLRQRIETLETIKKID
jgi:hypothetical protein